MNAPNSSCAYSGTTDFPLTRDHVVPRAFWKDAAMPSNPTTVPACKACQEYWMLNNLFWKHVGCSIGTGIALRYHAAASGPIKRRVEMSRRDLFDILFSRAVEAFHQLASS
jgi:hypothetical protein